MVKIFFRDEQTHDKARELMDQPEAEKVFQNFRAPENSYPSILRLYGVSRLGRVSEDGACNNTDLFNAGTKQNCDLITTSSKLKIPSLRKKLQVSVSFSIETTLL